MKEKILCIRLNDELVSKINELSSQYNISKSNLIRRMLYSFLSSAAASSEGKGASPSNSKNEEQHSSSDSYRRNSQNKEFNEIHALTSLSKEHYILKKKVEEMEEKQEKIYDMLVTLTSQLKTALQKE